MCSGYFDGLAELGLIRAYGLGVGSDLSQVLGEFDLDGRWVESLGQQLEPKACLLDLVVGVSPVDHLLSRGTGRTWGAAAWHG